MQDVNKPSDKLPDKEVCFRYFIDGPPSKDTEQHPGSNSRHALMEQSQSRNYLPGPVRPA